MKQVFRKTEHFWIDFGIVSLWRHFLEHYSDKATSTDDSSMLKTDKFHVELKPDCLVIEGRRKAIDDELRKMVGSLKEVVWREKARKEGEFWWSGVAQFFFSQQIKGPDRFLVTPSEMVSAKWRKGICDFCGRSDLKVQSIRTSENPLIVKFNKMRSFYSSLRGDLKICKNCTFASHFVASKAFFNINRNFLNVFVVQGTGLVAVDKFVSRLSSLYVVGEAYRNYPSILYYAKYPLENFLDFLISVWDKLCKLNPLTYEEAFGKSCHIIHAKREGRFVTIEHFYIIPDIYKILRIFGYMEWQDRTGKSHNAVTHVLNSLYFRRNKETDTVIREEFCRRLLYGADVLSLIEEFLHGYVLREDKVLSGFKVRNFRIFIKNYETKVMKMEEEILKNCESLGEALGQLTIKTNAKSILYALRSTRSFDDFLAAFHQIFMRYMDEIHVYRRGVKDLLKSIDERNWKRYRALIGIYAVLKYMEGKRKEKKGGE